MEPSFQSFNSFDELKKGVANNEYLTKNLQYYTDLFVGLIAYAERDKPTTFIYGYDDSYDPTAFHIQLLYVDPAHRRKKDFNLISFIL